MLSHSSFYHARPRSLLCLGLGVVRQIPHWTSAEVLDRSPICAELVLGKAVARTVLVINLGKHTQLWPAFTQPKNETVRVSLPLNTK